MVSPINIWMINPMRYTKGARLTIKNADMELKPNMTNLRIYVQNILALSGLTNTLENIFVNIYQTRMINLFGWDGFHLMKITMRR